MKWVERVGRPAFALSLGGRSLLVHRLISTWRWAEAADGARDLLEQAGVRSPLTDDARVQQATVRVGNEQLTAVKVYPQLRADVQVAAVMSGGYIAVMPRPAAAKRISAMRNGMSATVNGARVRLWRPRFGLRLRNRAICVAYASEAWQIVSMSSGRYRVLAANGSELLRIRRYKVMVDDALPTDQLTLLILLDICDIAYTSWIPYRIIHLY